MKTDGMIYAALVVLVLMGAVIVIQQEQIRQDQIQKQQPINVHLITYNEGGVVSDQIFPLTEKGSLGMLTDSFFIRENKVIGYTVEILPN